MSIKKNEEVEEVIDEIIDESHIDNETTKEGRSKITIVAILFALLLIVLILIGCADINQENQDIMGTGENLITLSIELPTQTLDYKIKTDSNTIEDVLMEYDLVQLTHLGMGSIINSIAGYELKENIDWYDVYVNGEIVYLQTSKIEIEDDSNYKIVIVKL